jgi:hypothetical protein
MMEHRAPVLLVGLLGSSLVVPLSLPAGATPPRVERLARSESARVGVAELVERVTRPSGKLGRGHALGASRRAMGELVTARDGGSYGVAGLRIHGAGRAGGGAGAALIPQGRVPTIGKSSPVIRRPRKQKLVKRISRAHVNRPLARMRRCLREVLRGQPGTSGRVVVRIVVDAVTGEVVSWKTSASRSRAAEACVERAVRRLRIPVRGRGGGVVIVTVPFKYR